MRLVATLKKGGGRAWDEGVLQACLDEIDRLLEQNPGQIVVDITKDELGYVGKAGLHSIVATLNRRKDVRNHRIEFGRSNGLFYAKRTS